VKQTAAILLFVIFSFNIFGYRILYNYMAGNADTRLEMALDNEAYDDASLISIKQATHLPYYSNSSTFTRLDGEVNIDGTIYKYVKYRVYKDSLELLCIPHVAKMKIQSSEDDFFKRINDIEQGKNSKKKDSDQKIGKISISEFEEWKNKIIPHASSACTTPLFFKNEALKSQVFISAAERPPDTIGNTPGC
jgi:hypothetical protein